MGWIKPKKHFKLLLLLSNANFIITQFRAEMKRRLLNLQDEKYVLDVTGILNNSVTMAQDNRSSPRSVCGQDHTRYTRAGILNNSVTMAQDNRTTAGALEQGSSTTDSCLQQSRDHCVEI